MRNSTMFVTFAAVGLVFGLLGGASLAEAGRGLGAMMTGQGIEAAIGTGLATQRGLTEGELLLTAFEPGAPGEALNGTLAKVACEPAETVARPVVSGPF